MDKSVLSFGLPGFRFKPTEEELISFYLKNIVYDKKLHIDIIGFLDIYQYDPWDLPGLARIGEREWYFVVPRDRKHFNGCGRPRRTTEYGFWKATGSDRKIVSMSDPKRVIGFRKTLVYYKGRAPRGSKTDWIMNEYRLPDNCALHKEAVLCKVYRKATSLRELEERASKEEANEEHTTQQYPTSPSISFSNCTTSINNGVDHQEDFSPTTLMSTSDHTLNLKREVNEGIVSSNSSNTIQLPFGREALGTLEVPKSGFDLVHDPFLSQSCSPWLENLLNFSSPTLAQVVL